MGIIERNYIVKINKLISEIDAVTENEYFHQHKEDFLFSVIDAVHAIADCYERNSNKVCASDKEFLLGFCYLNNQLKHDKSLDVFSIPVYSAVLPSRLPMRLGVSECSIIWADFENHGRISARAQRWHYDANLLNKDVKDTMLKARDILNDVVIL